MKIKFHYNVEKFRLSETKQVRKTILKIIRNAGLRGGFCNIIFTSDKELVKINKEFLDREYYTDIISFDYNEGKEVNGELYISIDTVKRNARELEVSIKSEIRRVIFHGILHLCGYRDNTEKEIAEMRDMEDLYLALAEAE